MGTVVRAQIRAIDERLDLTLADGTVLKLAGIDPAGPTPDDPDLDRSTGARLAAWLAGREISYRATARRSDRWGRMPALVFATADRPGEPALSVAAAVLDAGLGRFVPSKAVHGCLATFRAAEAAARRAKRGLWADPYYAVIAAEDGAALVEKSGTAVVVEGIPIGIEVGRFRTTLRFGPWRSRDFSVTVTQRNVEMFRAAGLDLAALQGKTLRVRGLLDTRFGPQIEISTPDEIEIVSDRADVAASEDEPSPAR